MSPLPAGFSTSGSNFTKQQPVAFFETRALVVCGRRFSRCIAAAERAQKEVQITAANPNSGLTKLVKLTVAQVAANPFTLEGALVELTGIRRVEIQEIEAGVYEVKIWGVDADLLMATLPQNLAAAAERSRTLLVSVSKPNRNRTSVIVHGNKAIYQGLSTMPTPAWK